MFLLSLKLDYFSNENINFLGPNPPFSYFKTCDISSQVQQKKPLRHLRRLLSEKRMHRLPINMFQLSLGEDHFFNETIIFLGSTNPFLYFKKCDISSRVQQKRSSQRPLLVPFRDKYAPTSKKYVSTEPKRKSLTSIKNEIFRCHSSVFIFQKLWYCQSNSAKKTLSDTSGCYFHRHVCPDFKKISFY